MAVKLNSMHVSQQHDFLMYVEASAKVSFFNRWKHNNSLLHDASDYYACFSNKNLVFDSSILPCRLKDNQLSLLQLIINPPHHPLQ